MRACGSVWPGFSILHSRRVHEVREGSAEEYGPANRGVVMRWEAYRFGTSLDSVFREEKDRALLGIARACPFPPNVVTIISFILGILAALAAVWSRKIALIFWLSNRVMDGLDGAVARAHNSATDFGGYLDIMCDFTVYASLPLGVVFGLVAGETWKAWCLAAVLEGVFFINAASLFCLSAILEKRAAGAKSRGEMTSVSMVESLIGGTESIILFTLMLLCPERWIPAIFISFSVLVALTIFQRLLWARHSIHDILR
jgi:phosphatidylglycerophosphate synthase